eukprot:12338489-Ditylum_brightwellii.AAC.1
MQRQSKHHAAELLAHLKPPCPPFSASFKHCRQWGKAGIAVFYAKKLLNIVLVDKQLTHVLDLLDQLGGKNSWQLSLATVMAVAAHCWIDTLMDTVTRSLML